MKRAENEAVVDEVVSAWTEVRGKFDAANVLKEHHVPAAPVRDLVEVTADPHMHARGMLHDVEHPLLGSIVLPTSPLRFDKSPAPGVRIEPGIGEHTEIILNEWLNYDQNTIAELRGDKIIG